MLVKLKTENFSDDLAQTFDTSAGHISVTVYLVVDSIPDGKAKTIYPSA